MDQSSAVDTAMLPEALKKQSEETQAWYEIEAQPLLEKSFKHHDTKGTGVLDKEEARDFFEHMVSESTGIYKAAAAGTVETGLKDVLEMWGPMMEEMPPDERDAMKIKMEQGATKA